MVRFRLSRWSCHGVEQVVARIAVQAIPLVASFNSQHNLAGVFALPFSKRPQAFPRSKENSAIHLEPASTLQLTAESIDGKSSQERD